jgi:hypothetical protein
MKYAIPKGIMGCNFLKYSEKGNNFGVADMNGTISKLTAQPGALPYSY